MDRTGLCKNEKTSVKVKITDTCACSYGPNAASNSRWCCGDQPHLDMSQVSHKSIAYLRLVTLFILAFTQQLRCMITFMISD